MKRLWLGVAILGVLLAAGILACCLSESTHSKTSRLLTEAAGYGAAGEWSAAKKAFSSAKAAWQTAREATAAITDHGPMEEIDRYFVQCQTCLEFRDPAAFCMCCKSLSVMVQAIGEAQSIKWWSLL